MRLSPKPISEHLLVRDRMSTGIGVFADMDGVGDCSGWMLCKVLEAGT